MRRWSLRATRDRADAALAAMLDAFPAGVEEEWEGDTVVLAGYADDGPPPGAPAGLRAEAVDPGWRERWREFHRPVRAGRLWVGPPWAEPKEPAVVIDPGHAFGTGAHGSTRAALVLLQRLDPRPVLDLGCGSGVLAIAAAKLGFAPVAAYDADRGAVAATAENARANGVALDRVERLDLRAGLPPAADVMCANLMRPLLLRVADLLQERPRELILSGLIDHEADEVATAFAPLRERRRVSSKGWTALLLAT